jgi:ABC-type bacteriocin/lantibiotic exporter with double-glycine peptidase domain
VYTGTGNTVKWVSGIITQHRKKIGAIIIIQVGSALLVSMQPMYLQRIVSLAVSENRETLLLEGMPLMALLSVVYVAGTMLNSMSGYLACTFSSDLLKQLQIDFFGKLSQLPLHFFNQQSSGEFITKFNSDVGKTQSFIANFLPSAMRELVTAGAVTAYLLYSCSFTLTFVALSIVLVTSLLVIQLNRLLMPYADAQREGWSEINRILDETVQGIDTLKVFANERARTEVFDRHTAEFRNLSVRAGTVAALFSPSIDLVSRMGGLILIFIAYFMISKNGLSLDQFLLFFFYAGLLQGSVSSLVSLLSTIQPLLVGVRNISSFLLEPSEEAEPNKLTSKIDKSVPIEISGLSFSYPGGRLLYRDADISIPANSITVIHGPSGSGKSTLINILSRFYAPISGSITIGGISIVEFDRLYLRQRISIMTQHHFLFNESLEMNLRVAKPDATVDEIELALECAHLGEFVRRLPGGIKAVMDPRGKGISGGEKQRICLARILLKKSAVMVLDEPWSSIDQEARDVLSQVINKCKKTATVIILTHEKQPSLAVDRTYNLLAYEGKFVLEDSLQEIK